MIKQIGLPLPGRPIVLIARIIPNRGELHLVRPITIINWRLREQILKPLHRLKLSDEAICGLGFQFYKFARYMVWTKPDSIVIVLVKATESNKEDLLAEYELMKQLQHPNIIRLIGAVTLSGKLCFWK